MTLDALRALADLPFACSLRALVPPCRLRRARPATAMRKINVGVSVSPPNVVHTTAYVAKELGLFAKHCIDVNIIQFDGGSSPAASVALTQGNTFATVSDVQVGRGMKVKQIWGLAPQGAAGLRGRRRHQGLRRSQG